MVVLVMLGTAGALLLPSLIERRYPTMPVKHRYGYALVIVMLTNLTAMSALYTFTQ